MPLTPRAQVSPAALVFPASRKFEGNDGSWSTFIVSVGGQDFDVLPFTNSLETWVPAADGCPQSAPPNCPSLRGARLVNNVQSAGYKPGVNATQIDVIILKPISTLNYFNDTVQGVLLTDTVGIGSASGNQPQLQQQLVMSVTDTEYWLGGFGLLPGVGAYANPPKDSWLRAYNGTGNLPSCTYGYTAGASYREPTGTRYGSLVFGGYDKSRVGANAVTYSLQESLSLITHIRQITVASDRGLQIPSINFTSGFYAEIDSTLPFLWLPSAVCDSFASLFSLTYDNKTGLYLIDDSNRQRFLQSNPDITFILDSAPNSANITSVTIPYRAFDLQASWPLYRNTTNYFPIRRSPTGAYVLGRSFLQHAYLFVDYDRRTFNVSPAVFPDPNGSNIITVKNPWADIAPSSAAPHSKSLGVGAIAGIAVAGGVVFLGILFVIWWFHRRRKQRQAPPPLPVMEQVKKDSSDDVLSSTSTAGGHRYTQSGNSHELYTPPPMEGPSYFAAGMRGGEASGVNGAGGINGGGINGRTSVNSGSENREYYSPPIELEARSLAELASDDHSAAAAVAAQNGMAPILTDGQDRPISRNPTGTSVSSSRRWSRTVSDQETFAVGNRISENPSEGDSSPTWRMSMHSGSTTAPVSPDVPRRTSATNRGGLRSRSGSSDISPTSPTAPSHEFNLGDRSEYRTEYR